jgi:hypothetical protein
VTAPVATRLIQSVGVLHTFAISVSHFRRDSCRRYFMQNHLTAGAGGVGANCPGRPPVARLHLGEALEPGNGGPYGCLFLNTLRDSVISQEAPLFRSLPGNCGRCRYGRRASIGNALMFGRGHQIRSPDAQHS